MRTSISYSHRDEIAKSQISQSPRRWCWHDAAVCVRFPRSVAMALISLISQAVTAHPPTRNGYALRFPGFATIAAPRALTLDPANAQIARLASGFTISVWLRFEDLTPSRWVYPVAIFHEEDSLWFGPFGGVHGGFQMESRVSNVVASLGENATCWHHYVQSWNQTTGKPSGEKGQIEPLATWGALARR